MPTIYFWSIKILFLLAVCLFMNNCQMGNKKKEPTLGFIFFSFKFILFKFILFNSFMNKLWVLEQ